VAPVQAGTAGFDAASALTSAVVNGLPAIPQWPLLTSSITVQVTGRMASPSIDTRVSVSLRMIWAFYSVEKTPSMSLTLMKGM